MRKGREELLDTNEFGLRWQSVHGILIAPHHRYVPEWIYSNLKVQTFIRHRYPGAFYEHVSPSRIPGRQKARDRAAQLAAVLYLAFRILLPYEEIDDALDLRDGLAESVAWFARKHGDLFFAGAKCCPSQARQALK